MKFIPRVCAAAAAACLLWYPTIANAGEEKVEAAVSPTETKPDPDLAAKGAQLYAQHCSHCHGFNMVNPGTVAYDLRTFPHNDKNRFVNSVTKGKNNRMPPWGDLLTKDEIDRLWAYISSYKQP